MGSVNTFCLPLRIKIKTGVWIQWNGIVDWNAGMEWMFLISFHLIIVTPFEQRPPVNKDHPNLMTK